MSIKSKFSIWVEKGKKKKKNAKIFSIQSEAPAYQVFPFHRLTGKLGVAAFASHPGCILGV
jgi:hypothetical protein